MKIVGVDNLNRETVADRLWLDGILEDPEGNCRVLAQRVCDKLNEPLDRYEDGFHYVIKKDDYRLSRGMEDLV